MLTFLEILLNVRLLGVNLEPVTTRHVENVYPGWLRFLSELTMLISIGYKVLDKNFQYLVLFQREKENIK